VVAIGDVAVPRAVDFDAGTGWILIRPYLDLDLAEPEPVAAVEEDTVLLPLVPRPRPASSARVARRRDDDGPPVGRHALRRRGGRRSLVLLAAVAIAGLIAVAVGILLANTGGRSGGSGAAAVDATRAGGVSRPSDQPQPADPATLAAPLPNGGTTASAGTLPQPGPGAGRSPSAALPPTWAPPPAVDLTGPITNVAGLCLGSSDDRARLWNCDGTSSQGWTLATDGTLRLGGQCLQPGAGLARLRDCDGSAAQQWRVGPAGSLVDPAALACLGDPEAGANKGTPERTAPCDQSDAQRWTLPGTGT
jgi:hypothetical protein